MLPCASNGTGCCEPHNVYTCECCMQGAWHPTGSTNNAGYAQSRTVPAPARKCTECGSSREPDSTGLGEGEERACQCARRPSANVVGSVGVHLSLTHPRGGFSPPHRRRCPCSPQREPLPSFLALRLHQRKSLVRSLGWQLVPSQYTDTFCLRVKR